MDRTGQPAGATRLVPPPIRRTLGVKWSPRNNVNMQQSEVLLALNFVANNKERFRRTSTSRASGPLLKPPMKDRCLCCARRPITVGGSGDMVNLLRLMGVEVHTATKEILSSKIKVSRRVVRDPYGSTLLAHGRHAFGHTVLQRQRSASLRRYGLDIGSFA